MADHLKAGPIERDVDQAITALKKGTQLLKYGRRGKPKFCPFRLSSDECTLIWYSGRKEKQLKLSNVSKMIPGQRTAIFQRYPRPDKEYQSFSLIYQDGSLDVICKDKDEAEVWFVGLKALIARVNHQKWRAQSIRDVRISADAYSTLTSSQKNSSPNGGDCLPKDCGNTQNFQTSYVKTPANSFGRVFSDVILYTSQTKNAFQSDLSSSPRGLSVESGDVSNERGSAAEAVRVSLSSGVSSSSRGSGYEEFDALGDVFFWGEGVGDGLLGGGLQRIGSLSSTDIHALLPKALESTVALDVHNIACGNRHAALVTRQGEAFSWGEESGGRLGHGVDADLPNPKLIEALSGMNIESLACGEYHTCAITYSGDLYTWGDGAHSSGLLGHGSEASHWVPRKMGGPIEGLHVSAVYCGPWHSAIVTSTGQIYTFGDGTFGALGHGDRTGTNIPREVEALKGMRTVWAACGVWHTAAVVEIIDASSDCSSSSSGRLFTWGDGDKGQLGHGDREPRLIPACVSSLSEHNFCQVACGNDVTVALATSGQVYTMGSSDYGQLGNPTAEGKHPTCIGGTLCDTFVEEIACGSYHIAVLTSKTEVYTWGRGANGCLGHGDNDNRNTPTLVEALKDKQVKSVACGSSFTAVICLHKWVSSADQSVCAGCHLPFGFRRKRHNCYNCGLVFCKTCTSKKSVKASLAPSISKPYRVCDDCFVKLKKIIGDRTVSRKLKASQSSNEFAEKDRIGPKLQWQMSRLSSFYSFRSESKQSRHQVKSELNDCRLPPVLRGSFQWRCSHPSSSSSLQGSSKKIFSDYIPSPGAASRSTSPAPSWPSPPHPVTSAIITDQAYPEMADSIKQPTDDLSQQVVKLQLQVEELTRKSQLLEAELETTSRQLKEATAKADEEAEKCNTAKEVIKSLTAQLEDIAEKLSCGCSMNNDSGSVAHHTSHSSKLLSSESKSKVAISQVQGSNCDSNNSLPCNGIMTAPEEVEWVEQVAPGVYITVSSLAGGGKHLKRVRFSRKRFTEQKAEQWWAENKSKLQENFGILSRENSSRGTSAASWKER